MELILRLAAPDEDFNYDTNLSLIDILDKYLLDFSFESILNLIIPALSKLNYLECQNKKELYYTYIIALSYAISDKRLKNNYQNHIITIFTRTNAILIINYIYYRKDKFRNKKIELKDLYYLLLIINDIENKTSSNLSTISIKPKKINSDDALKIAASLIKSNGFQNISLLRFPNVDRSYKIINELLKTKEGISCNTDYINKYGFDIKEYFRITWATYHFMYLNYENNNFSNIIDFNQLFNTIVKKDSQEQKLKQAFTKVFDKLSSFPTAATEDDITLYNTGFLWYNNIKKIGKDKYLILDIGLFITAAFTNIFLTFEAPYLSIIQNTNISKNANPLRSEALGICFETFCNELMSKFSDKKDLNRFYKSKKGQNKNEIADIFFRIKDSLFFIECKAGYLKYQDIVNKTPEDLINNIFNKYGGQYIDETNYKNLPSNQRKGTVQIIHNYVKLNDALIKNDFSIYENGIELENELKTIKKVYGIVLIEEPYLSSEGLNTVLYLRNKPVTNKLFSKRFYAPIYVYVNDLYKIIYNEDKINNKELTFESAISNYLAILESRKIPQKFYSFHSFIVNEYNAPIEISKKDNNDLLKKIMNEIYESVGLPLPNE